MQKDLITLLTERKTTRAISTQKLNSEIVAKLMEAAQLSASCYNNQPWRFLFLASESALDKGRKALSAGNNWARKAPLLIAGFTKIDLDCRLKDGRNYYLFDLGMATQLLLLQATELNLVARPMAGYSPNIITSEFSIPDEYEVFILIAVGYEGNLEELDERLKTMSAKQRIRNDLNKNFFLDTWSPI